MSVGDSGRARHKACSCVCVCMCASCCRDDASHRQHACSPPAPTVALLYLHPVHPAAHGEGGRGDRARENMHGCAFPGCLSPPSFLPLFSPAQRPHLPSSQSVRASLKLQQDLPCLLCVLSMLYHSMHDSVLSILHYPMHGSVLAACTVVGSNRDCHQTPL